MRNLLEQSLLVILIFARPVLADDIAWGESNNGLRIGIACKNDCHKSDTEPRLLVALQNVSKKPITFPSLGSFIRGNDPDNIYSQPLRPVKDKNCLTAWGWGLGDSVEGSRETVITLSPGETRKFEEIPLNSQSYDRLWHKKAMLGMYALTPDHECPVQFEFLNRAISWARTNVWHGAAFSGTIIFHPRRKPAHVDIEGSFELPKREYFVGEPVYARFQVKNKGRRFAFPDGGDYRGYGRHERFSCSAVAEATKSASDTKLHFTGVGGGLGGNHMLESGQTYSETILLNAWNDFSKPGEYSVTCRRTLEVLDTDSLTSPQPHFPPLVPIANSMTLVMHKDSWALWRYLFGLAQNVSKSYPGGQTAELRSLAWAKVPEARVVIRLLGFFRRIDQNDAKDMLSYYDDRQSLKAPTTH